MALRVEKLNEYLQWVFKGEEKGENKFLLCTSYVRKKLMNSEDRLQNTKGS